MGEQLKEKHPVITPPQFTISYYNEDGKAMRDREGEGDERGRN